MCFPTLAAAEEAKELVVWAPWDYDTSSLGKIAQQSGYSVRFVKPGFTMTRNTLEAAPERPDLIFSPHTWLDEWKETIEPIEPLIKDQIDLGQFSHIGLEALSLDDKLYGLPLSIDVPLLIYNKDLFRQAGLDPDSPPQTWDDFIKYADDFIKYANKMNLKDKYGFMYPANSIFYTSAFFSAYGINLFSSEDLRSPEAADVAKDVYLHLFEENLVPRDTDYNKMDSSFKKGDVPMIINGSWSLADYRAAGINYGIAKIPQLPNGEYARPPVTVYGMYLTKFSQKKQLAAKFMTLISQPDNLVKLANSEGKAPSLNREYPGMPAVWNFLRPDLIPIAEQARFGEPLPSSQEIYMFISPLSTALGSISSGTKSPKEALDEASRASEKIVPAKE